MKKQLFFVIVLLFATMLSQAQLKATVRCEPFFVDILNGKVNGLKPTAGIEEIKTLFPCFTGTEAETPTSKCGGAVSFADKDLYFFTGRDYVVIGEKFKGKLSVPILGATRNSLFKHFGNPLIKDTDWDAFQVQYGTLILKYSKAGKVNKIIFSTMPSSALQLCE